VDFWLEKEESARPSLHEEDESGMGLCWPLGCTGRHELAAKENREGGRLGRFRKESKIQPKTIERIEKPF
jgi:hypothetical protein